MQPKSITNRGFTKVRESRLVERSEGFVVSIWLMLDLRLQTMLRFLASHSLRAKCESLLANESMS